jgi:DNA mismatch endonuclease (patch repair protein)
MSLPSRPVLKKMTDIFSRKKRSEIMSHIRSKNTSIEKRVFRYLRSKSIYFQSHYRRIAGCPDIALPSKKRAVFIDGDFWHGWSYAKTGSKLPNEFWRTKIEANMRRDKRNRRALRRRGWEVVRIWEHQLEKRSGSGYEENRILSDQNQ